MLTLIQIDLHSINGCGDSCCAPHSKSAGLSGFLGSWSEALASLVPVQFIRSTFKDLSLNCLTHYSLASDFPQLVQLENGPGFSKGLTILLQFH